MQTPSFPVTATSVWAADFLTDKNRRGTVHSVYRKTINIQLDGQLFALQAAGSPLSPLSLITNLSAAEMSVLQAAPGMEATVETVDADGRGTAPKVAAAQIDDAATQTTDAGCATQNLTCAIQLGGFCRFSLAQAARADLDLEKKWRGTPAFRMQETSLAHLEPEIFSVLASRDAGSFELLFSNPARAAGVPFLAVAAGRLRDAGRLLEEKRWPEAAETLRALIGLGLGLTPGGDDFLCGVLAGLILCGQSSHSFAAALRAQLREHLCDTNDVSAAFLSCALHGQFSQAVNSLTGLPKAAEILSSFSSIGHSSGTDTLCGVYFVLLVREALMR